RINILAIQTPEVAVVELKKDKPKPIYALEEPTWQSTITTRAGFDIVTWKLVSRYWTDQGISALVQRWVTDQSEPKS
ncbi:MAG: hypothetical protein L6R42_011042, partial [Xanthoria sp. 1 TBL-2021]